jgi:uncharacterized repeat protein (TIGR03803 family)
MKTSRVLAAIITLAGLVLGGSARADTFKTLHDFRGVSDGAEPLGGLVQGIDGNFYGTTAEGGLSSAGTFFKITPGGALTSFSFISSGGAMPSSGLIRGSDSNFYGTTFDGGLLGSGAAFKITSSGTFTPLFDFSGSQGEHPFGGLVEGADRAFYGTTTAGGTSGKGVVFKITGGVLTPLHSFIGSDGAEPFAGLVQGSDSNFYGTTVSGGAFGSGTVFQVTADGALTPLHNFNGADGSQPYGGLIEGKPGTFYGTTFGGGTGAGTVFRITANGGFETLYEFSGGEDGSGPMATLARDGLGNLYGTTIAGGAGAGTLFQITPGGNFALLHMFISESDGGAPHGALVQGGDGKFYGTASEGGPNGDGTVFELIRPCAFAISPSHVILSASENNGTISITASGTNCGWSAVGKVSWITITSATNGFGDGTVAYSVTANTGTATRSSTIIVAGKIFTVAQQGEVFGQFLQGTYNGLIEQTGTASAAGSGSIALNFARTGAFTASLTVGGVRSSFKGQFDMSGNATNTVTPKNLSPLQIILQVLKATNQTDQITGTVSNGTFNSDVLANVATFGAINLCPFAGQYTFVLIPTNSSDVTVPQGDGFGTLTVTTAGSGHLQGELGDGTKISVVAPVSADGTWPLYEPLYQHQGSCIGWVTFGTSNSIEATVDWFKPAIPKDHFYSGGFTTTVMLSGAPYISPSAGGPSVAESGTLTLGGGDLVSNIVQSVVISSSGVVTVAGPNIDKLALKVQPKTGQIIGSFLNTAINKTSRFSGLLLQSDGSGGGLFLGTNQSGFVTLQPSP